MSLKTINFEVKKDGVFPKTVQPAGSQGDHQVTNVVFKLDEGLITGINSLPGDTVFRVQTTDGAGGYHSSELLTFNGEARTITFPIEEDISIPGGIAVLHLVISKIVDQESTDKFFSFPARIKFAGESLGTGSEEQYRKDIDSALLGAKKAEGTATSALQEIRVLADDTEHAAISVKAVLGADNTYIFDGGKPSEIPSSSASVKMIVDSELNTLSKNPVENRVVAKKIGELADGVSEIEEDVSSVKEITDEISSTGDFIVETGVNKVWTYEKRNSGIIELWGKATDLKAGYGDENGFNRIWLPFPVYDFTLHVSAISWQVDKVKVSDVSVDNNTTIEFYLLYNTSENANITDAEAFITIKGFWK